MIEFKFGISHPGTMKGTVDLAIEAEKAGWDGFFLWDHILGPYPEPVVPIPDPWILLGAIAARTKRIRLGAQVTPLARRRPWKVARETVTLDYLSNGRLIFGVGLGNPPAAFDVFGEESDNRIRATKLDEGLEILIGLWSGQPFTYEGQHFEVKEVTFLPKPIQEPRIPIWVGGFWPNRAPFRRAAKWEGVIPTCEEPNMFRPKDLREIVRMIRNLRGNLENYDIVAMGTTTGVNSSKDSQILHPWIDSGATWWTEVLMPWIQTEEEILRRIQAGPPIL